jgi:excisionase family DNA binding protein
MSRETLSTGESARLCSVKPDTVLKWIKKGRLTATRTAGGHYRIEKRDLMPFVPALVASNAVSVESIGSPREHLRYLRCWEYLSQSGEVREQCLNCAVYRVPSVWCFQVVGSVECETHRKMTNCDSSCTDCAYYRRATGQATNVLVVTGDKEFAEAVSCGTDALAIRIARNGDEASAMISVFHAAFIVVDQDVIASGSPGLIDSLATNFRLPGVRIILAVPKGEGARSRVLIGNAIIWVVEKPFGSGAIAEIVSRFPVELVPMPDQVQRT